MKQKPKNCKYPDCFRCPYEDCIVDDINDRSSQKALEYMRRYIKTPKGKAAIRKYAKSDKGRETQRRYSKKIIANGKNADNCRSYYQRHREEILAKKKTKYEEQKLIGEKAK